MLPAQVAAARSHLAADEKRGVPPRPLLDLLAEEGAVDTRKLARLLAVSHGVPFVDVRSLQPDPEAIRSLARSWAERHVALPYALEGRVLRLAVADPLDFETLDSASETTGLAIEPAAAAAEDLRQAIRWHYRAEEAVETSEPDDAPVVQLVESLLSEAVARRASDVHFEPLERRFRVRFRIDGVLQSAADPPRALARAVVSRLKIIADLSIAEKRLPQDGRARFRQGGRAIDLRVSTLPTAHGESVVLRLLEPETVRRGLGELGLDDEGQRCFAELLGLADGMVLVTGPTGSGKTSTLYACLQELNQAERKIITVEDPVEYQIAGINQVAVCAEIGMTFAAALRAMLRQAPNVIMVGEIRDRETAEIAVHAALTGHLVFSTLHTNDAAGAVVRLLDIGLKPFLVASALRAVVAQRLVRRVCASCGGAGGACAGCGGTGFRGRLPLFEWLLVDDALQEMIHGGVEAARMRAHARAQGMRSLRDDGWRKVRAGLTTAAEVLAETVGEEGEFFGMTPPDSPLALQASLQTDAPPRRIP